MKNRRLPFFLENTLERLSVFWSRLRFLYNHYVKPVTSFLFVLVGIFTILVLVAEFGFYLPQTWRDHVHIIAQWLVYYLLFYEITSFIFTPRESFLVYTQTHKLQLGIIFASSGLLFFRDPLINYLNLEGMSTEKAALSILWLNQFVLIFGGLLHLARRSGLIRLRKLTPAGIFLLSFALIILSGMTLLHLPRMQNTDLSSLDLFFTSVSATCVTGLATIDITTSLTRSGQMVVLGLIQIGGLGLMTLTSFFVFFLMGRASVSTQIMMKDLLSESSMGRVKSILKEIALLTLWIEGSGALYLFLTMPEHLYSSPSERIFLAMFHSISAFCNAGFSLHPGSLTSLGPEGYPYLLGISLLILLGGLGVPVIIALLQKAVQPRSRFIRFSVSTKLVLYANLTLYAAGFLAYFFLEQKNTLKGLPLIDQIVHSYFYSITLRTAGFNTLPMENIGSAMVFASFFFMWIGASPLSTGGGIKTSTVAVSLIHMASQLSGKNRVEIFHRDISPESVSRAFATIVLSLMVIFMGTFVLLLIEGGDFLDIAFETVSAFGTVGLSRGITPNLQAASKLILCFLMLVGRVGIFTALIAFMPAAKDAAYRYPREYVAVG